MPYADYDRYLECCRKAGRRCIGGITQRSLSARVYREWNREEIARKQREYTARKRAEDPTHRVRTCLQISWKGRCRRAGIYHAEPFLKLLGCEWEAFARYLERRFKPGMSWENFGEWCIDHRLPVCAFNLKHHEDRAMCCHYTNLQPMWFDENRRKNGSFSKVELSLQNHVAVEMGPKVQATDAQ